jgi:Ca-activated chloride channel family protein
LKISARIDRDVVGPEGGRRYLWVRLEAPRRATRTQRPPLDIALVLDRSGSMEGDKIALAKQAARRAANTLREPDRCALVAFDDEVITAARVAPVDSAHRGRITAALNLIDARGSTDLFGGWLAGAEQVSAGDSARVRRVLQLTDGLANVGITDPAEIEAHVRALRVRGVSTTTFGVGRDFDEGLLSGMAEAGGGHYYYIQHERQIPDYLASELGELLTTIARSVRVRVHAGQQADLHCLNDLPMSGDVITLGDVSEAATIDLLFAVDIRETATGPVTFTVEVAWTDADSQADQATSETASVRAGTAQEAADAPTDADTIAQVIHTRGARIRNDALRHNRSGDFRAAKSAVQAELAELRDMAALAPEAAPEVDELTKLADRVDQAMDPAMSKLEHYASYNRRHSRSDPNQSR